MQANSTGDQRQFSSLTLVPPPRPDIIFSSTDQLRDRVDRVVTTLQNANKPKPTLFNRAGGSFARIGRDPDGRACLQVLNNTGMVDHLAQRANWLKYGANGKQVATNPPSDAIGIVMSRSDPIVDEITLVARVPVFLPDGTLTTTEGYYRQAKLYFAPDRELRNLGIPADPSGDDVNRAVKFLRDELLADFPFRDNASFANAIAASLTPYIRPMIPGSVPVWLVDGPVAGTGKTLLVNVLLGADLFGGGVATSVEVTDKDEWRKRLTALLEAASPVIAIDNVNQYLDSSALASAITTGWWEDRRLGKTETMRMPVRCLFTITGNNVSMSRELSRRMLPTRLDADTDNPAGREGFRHRLPDWANNHRLEILTAKLTIIQAWAQLYRDGTAPKVDHPAFGSFETWADTMASILACADIEGFLENMDDYQTARDPEHATWEKLAAACVVTFGERWASTTEILDVVNRNDDVLIDLGNGSDKAQATALGKMLRHKVDGYYAGHKLRARVLDGRSLYLFDYLAKD